jgi:hypothetical protein
MRKSPSKTEKAHDTHRKAASKNRSRKSTRKITVENRRGLHRTAALTVASDQMLDTRFLAEQFEGFRDAQVPATLRDLAETNIAQTRELYERSKDTLQSVLTSWQKSFGAANQGAVALNLKIMDIAERKIRTGFDITMN